MATSTDTTTADYRVTSINEAGEDRVTVNFTEVIESDGPNPGGYYGGFSRTLPTADAATYFPGQVYTMTLTKKSDAPA